MKCGNLLKFKKKSISLYLSLSFITQLESISNTASKIFKNPFRTQAQTNISISSELNPHQSTLPPPSAVSLLQPLPAKRYCYENKSKKSLVKGDQEELKQKKELQQHEQKHSKKHSLQFKRNTKSSSSHHLSLRNIIKPIALRPSEYETYLLTKTFLNMTIKSSQTTEIINSDCSSTTSSSTSSTNTNDDAIVALSNDFKSSTISLPIIDIKSHQCVLENEALQAISLKNNDISRFQRLSISHSSEPTTTTKVKKNRLNSKSPSLLISSQNFIKKKRRLDLNYDNNLSRPYINLEKMKSKLISESHQNEKQSKSNDHSKLNIIDDDIDNDYDFVDEGIDCENQSAYSSSSSFYSNSSYNNNNNTNTSIAVDSVSSESLNIKNNEEIIVFLLNEENKIDDINCNKSSHYSNIKFIDIDLNQIEND